jgi:Fe-S cluster assembly protein SufD
VLVVLGAGSEATVLTETAGGGTSATGGFHCGGTEIVVGPNAFLRMVNLQNWNTGVWHFARQRAVVHAGARLQWTLGALGSRLSQVAQDVALVGRGADAQVNGVMFTEGRQQLVYNTLQHHEAPGCRSDLLYKGALQDRSRLVWRGMIKVDKAAQKTDGYQRNDNLMLSKEARADSIPGLEIEADDVRCTHGATSGRVDAEQVFYAQARGLTADEAARLVVAGFFQQVFDRITIAPVRDALARAIGRRIRRIS